MDVYASQKIKITLKRITSLILIVFYSSLVDFYYIGPYIHNIIAQTKFLVDSKSVNDKLVIKNYLDINAMILDAIAFFNGFNRAVIKDSKKHLSGDSIINERIFLNLRGANNSNEIINMTRDYSGSKKYKEMIKNQIIKPKVKSDVKVKEPKKYGDEVILEKKEGPMLKFLSFKRATKRNLFLGKEININEFKEYQNEYLKSVEKLKDLEAESGDSKEEKREDNNILEVFNFINNVTNTDKDNEAKIKELSFWTEIDSNQEKKDNNNQQEELTFGFDFDFEENDKKQNGDDKKKKEDKKPNKTEKKKDDGFDFSKKKEDKKEEKKEVKKEVKKEEKNDNSIDQFFSFDNNKDNFKNDEKKNNPNKTEQLIDFFDFGEQKDNNKNNDNKNNNDKNIQNKNSNINNKPVNQQKNITQTNTNENNQNLNIKKANTNSFNFDNFKMMNNNNNMNAINNQNINQNQNNNVNNNMNNKMNNKSNNNNNNFSFDIFNNMNSVNNNQNNNNNSLNNNNLNNPQMNNQKNIPNSNNNNNQNAKNNNLNNLLANFNFPNSQTNTTSMTQFIPSFPSNNNTNNSFNNIGFNFNPQNNNAFNPSNLALFSNPNAAKRNTFDFSNFSNNNMLAQFAKEPEIFVELKEQVCFFYKFTSGNKIVNATSKGHMGLTTESEIKQNKDFNIIFKTEKFKDPQYIQKNFDLKMKKINDLNYNIHFDNIKKNENLLDYIINPNILAQNRILEPLIGGENNILRYKFMYNNNVNKNILKLDMDILYKNALNNCNMNKSDGNIITNNNNQIIVSYKNKINEGFIEFPLNINVFALVGKITIIINLKEDVISEMDVEIKDNFGKILKAKKETQISYEFS